MRASLFTFLSVAFAASQITLLPVSADFVHPGISHGASELAFVKSKIEMGEQPWTGAWEELQGSKSAKLDWKPRPVAHVERGPYNRPDIGGNFFLRDGSAAYTHALMWNLTGEEVHAAKAAEILDAWPPVLETISNHDARLLVGMGGINFCNAAELLKHTWDQWPEDKVKAFEGMLRGVFYPVIENFYPTANGNWDASMIQTMMATGVFLDDQKMFQRAVDYFLKGEGNGAVNHYFNAFGQCQESGRDQAHTQMGIEYLANAAEMGWKQGLDLYGAYENRLAKGFEYTARYNLGEDVPFEPYRSYKGRYEHDEVSDKARGRLRGMYDKAHTHYHLRLGREMPWTKKAIEKTRPERGSGSGIPWSTLMFANQPKDLVPRRTSK